MSLSLLPPGLGFVQVSLEFDCTFCAPESDCAQALPVPAAAKQIPAAMRMD